MAPRGPRDPNSIRSRMRNAMRDIVDSLGGDCLIADARQAFARSEGKDEMDYGSDPKAPNSNPIYFEFNRAVDDHIKMGSLIKSAYKRVALNREWQAPTAPTAKTPKVKTPKVKTPILPPAPVVEPVEVVASVEPTTEPMLDGEVEVYIDPITLERVGVDARGREWRSEPTPSAVVEATLEAPILEVIPEPILEVIPEPTLEVISEAPISEAPISEIVPEPTILEPTILETPAPILEPTAEALEPIDEEVLDSLIEEEEGEAPIDIKKLDLNPCSIKLKNGGMGNYLVNKEGDRLIITTSAKKDYVVVDLSKPAVEFESEKQRKIWEGGLDETGRWVVKCLVYCKEKCNHSDDYAGFKTRCSDHNNCPLSVWNSKYVG